MINQLHSYFHNPNKGWDPVSKTYADEYAAYMWSNPLDEEAIDRLASWSGGFEGKTVLDLGAGPGQYSVEFAKRGAKVTWFDISKNYQTIAMQKSKAHGVDINFSMGYLDYAYSILQQQFDIVFNRVCWYYCFNDRVFANVFYQLITSQGVGYVITNVYQVGQKGGFSSNIKAMINHRLGLKIGHPYPPSGRVAQLLSTKKISRLLADYRQNKASIAPAQWADHVLVEKS